MDDGFLSDDEIDNAVFRLSPDVTDDDLDRILGAAGADTPPVFRGSETEPTAEMLGEMTGDPEWAAEFSREMAQLDTGGRGLLELEEERALLRSVAEINGDRGFTLEELHAVRVWANRVRIGQALLDSVLEGDLVVGWDEIAGDVVFRPADGFEG